MPRIGDQLAGRYRLDARIGSGGSATVFRARDLRLDRDVAVKVLLANQATDPVVAARFDREARVLAAVSHPNVVAIHDVAASDPVAGAEPFLVMDLCAGGSLADRLASSATGTLSPVDLLPVLVEVAAGLEALHLRGIVHRDLKPSNILLAEGRAQIADLGIAAAGPSELTAPGTAIGTLAYLAPEQLAGAPASPESDVHALGVIAVLGLTGRLPRSAGSVTELVAASLRPVDPVSALAPGLGPAFDLALAPALAVQPSQRPTATEFGATLAAALERWRAAPLPVASPDATTLTSLQLPVAHGATAGVASTTSGVGRMIVAVATLIAALLMGLAAFVLLRPDGSVAAPSPSILIAGFATGPSASASASATATPAPTATPTAPPTPTPVASVDPYAAAVALSAEMRSAIEASRGREGLKGHEPRDLERQLDRFDQALDELDAKAARDAANQLAGLVAELIDRRAVDAQAADRLRMAADRLVAAADALPR
jgi:hypothetical protein